VITNEILMAINVAIPLSSIGPVLVALVLDDQLVREIDQVDAPDWAIVVTDDEIALGHRKARQHQAESEPCFPRRVHTFPNQLQRRTGGDSGLNAGRLVRTRVARHPGDASIREFARLCP